MESQTGAPEEHVSITIQQGNGVLMRFRNNANLCLNFTEGFNSTEQTHNADKLQQ